MDTASLDPDPAHRAPGPGLDPDPPEAGGGMLAIAVRSRWLSSVATAVIPALTVARMLGIERVTAAAPPTAPTNPEATALTAPGTREGGVCSTCHVARKSRTNSSTSNTSSSPVRRLLR